MVANVHRDVCELRSRVWNGPNQTPSAEGWRWVDAERTTVDLLGSACASFTTSSRTNVFVEFGCEPVTL